MLKAAFGGLGADFWLKRPLIGMVHLRALPGSAGDSGGSLEETIALAVADAKAIEAGGATAVMIENFFDAPFAKASAPPHTIATMTRAAFAVRQATTLPLGVNVSRNDAISALAIAQAVGAQFVRVNVWVGAAVTDQGVIEGAARGAILYRREIGADVAIFADVFVKHAVQLGGGSIVDAARDAVLRGRADALIVSGSSTGAETPIADLTAVRQALPDTPLLVGSGINPVNGGEMMRYASGAIAGTSIKEEGRVHAPVSAERVRSLRATMIQGVSPRATSGV